MIFFKKRIKNKTDTKTVANFRRKVWVTVIGVLDEGKGVSRMLVMVFS